MSQPAHRMLATASRFYSAISTSSRHAVRGLSTTASRLADRVDDASSSSPDSAPLSKLTKRSAYNPTRAPPPSSFSAPSAAPVSPSVAPGARHSQRASVGGGAGAGGDDGAPKPNSLFDKILGSVGSNAPAQTGRGGTSGHDLYDLDGVRAAAGGGPVANADELAAGGEPFHFHVMAHKHNTHVTVTRPNRDCIISMSTGNIGFKKGKRGSYDAAYQLTAYVIDKLNQGGWHRTIGTLEVVLRGFGQGREAATKVLMGNEGKYLRPKIVKLSDATRLKFGGTRSPKPRRLG